MWNIYPNIVKHGVFELFLHENLLCKNGKTEHFCQENKLFQAIFDKTYTYTYTYTNIKNGIENDKKNSYH